jgi:hypothetical protein
LQTNNLTLPVLSSPNKATSPSLKHWQQVRSHVLATPAEEKAVALPQPTKGKKLGLVSKAAGRFGFRHAAENVMGYDDRRRSLTAMLGDLGDLTAEERETIARERRKFARDVKACLDACALEESRRRLWRAAQQKEQRHAKATSMHGSQHTAQRYTFDPDFSAFAPLLTELHKHLPAARARRPWSRTCPHHGAILAELGVAFLSDATSTAGERLQALEVFGAVAKNWAADNAEEELDRWIFLCQALRVDDRQLRTRGLTLLKNFLRHEPTLPRGPDLPHTTLEFQALAISLVELLHAIEDSSYDAVEHLRSVNELMTDLGDGKVIEVDEASLAQVLGSVDFSSSLSSSTLSGIEKELLWLAVGKALGMDQGLASWLLASHAEILRVSSLVQLLAKVLQRFMPPPLLQATPPAILHLRSLAYGQLLPSFAAIIPDAEAELLIEIWDAIAGMIDDLEILPVDNAAVAFELGRCLVLLELQLHREQVPQGSVDPFTLPSQDTGLPKDHRAVLERFLGDGRWRPGIMEAVRTVISVAPWGPGLRMIRSFLENKSFVPLGSESVPPLFDASIPSPDRKYPDLHSDYPHQCQKPKFGRSSSLSPPRSRNCCTNPSSPSPLPRKHHPS